MAIKVSIINFKGGVGKTTIVLHLAAGISYYHNKKVLLIDVDHQSSLSLVILGKRWERIIDGGQVVNRIFTNFTENSPMPDKSIIVKSPYQSDYPTLDIVPASLELDEIELDLASTTKGDAVHSEFIKRTLITNWIDYNNLDNEYDYIFFDCPPATKLVSQNAIAASNYYLVPVIPDAISSRGIDHLVNLLNNRIDKKISGLADYLMGKGKEIPKSYCRETELAGVIISKIRKAGNAYSGYTNDHTQHLKTIIDRWGSKIVEPYIEEGTGIPEVMAQGFPVYDKPNNNNISRRNYVEAFKKLMNNTMKILK